MSTPTPPSAAGPARSFAELAATYLPDVVLVLDREAVVRWVSDAVTGILGHQPDDLVGVSAFELVHPDDVVDALDGLENIRSFPGRLAPSIYRVRTADGGWLPMEVGGDVRVDDPEVEAIVVAARSITHRTLLDAVLQALAAGESLESSLALLAHAMSSQLSDIEVVVSFDDDHGDRRSVGAELPRPLTGVVPESDTGTAPWHRSIATGEPFIDRDLEGLTPDVRALAAARGLTSCAATAVPEFGDRTPACIIIWSPDPRLLQVASNWSTHVPRELLELALERRHHLAALEHAAHHDPLTGLPNRTVFFASLELDHERRPGAGRTLLYLDLDEFKEVNDTYGHTAGDAMLITVADRIRAQLRPGDLVARLGGDELAVFCPGTVDVADAENIAARLIDAICRPADIGPTVLTPSVSIGVAVDGDGSLDSDALVERADRAVYRVKRDGRGGWQVEY